MLPVGMRYGVPPVKGFFIFVFHKQVFVKLVFESKTSNGFKNSFPISRILVFPHKPCTDQIKLVLPDTLCCSLGIIKDIYVHYPKNNPIL